MAKQLNVKLNFEADTSRAKQQIQDLQNSLNNVINAPTNKLGAGISTNIQAAIKDVANLQYELNKATNADTGKIDFTKLNHSIAKSGKSLQQYGQQLMSLGPMGQQAFGQLAQAIANSEIPVFRINNKLKELGTTLANTVRWQLSSSIMHGFMGTVQSAFGYARDLNESLNNIRIVTGQNVDQMAKFAQEANKAAKALSTTTTEYTNASLIYYQQGLSDKEVKERTDVTIKMANVARESAETVSDQMTAVWNNFYDGSKSLEYYADVMTALGAATASSTAEISEGLNKFAAVAETVGLSYEYATAALATVTATTRQSADVVGTAFKTLFARIQDLELGNTLDDGTTLGSYSQALEKVGINIIDTSGNLKRMDVILEEMAARWETLSKAEQTALAQNVAGVRQYTQLIALMENWDFMKENISIASNATGTLQAQADIYAESWEAAQDRVHAAAEKIYSSLINDDFFIDLTNGFEDILSVLGKFIDSIGGLKGILISVGVLMTSVFSDTVARGLTNMSLAIQSMTQAGRAKIAQQREAAIGTMVEDFKKQQLNPNGIVEKTETNNLKNTLNLSNLMIQNENKMSEMEKDQNRRLIERLKMLQDINLEKAKELAILQEQVEYEKARLESQIRLKSKNNKNIQEHWDTFNKSIDLSAQVDNVYRNLGNKTIDVKQARDKITKIFDGGFQGIDINKILGNKKDLDSTRIALLDISEILATITESQKKALSAKGIDISRLDTYVKKSENVANTQRNLKKGEKDLRDSFKATEEAILSSTGVHKGFADALVAGANIAMSAAMMINNLRSAISTLKNPDISGWEKFTSILMSFGMVIPSLISLFKSFTTVISKETISKIANAGATMAQVRAEQALAATKGNKGFKQKIINGMVDPVNNLKTNWNSGALEAIGEKGSTKHLTVSNGHYYAKELTDKQKIKFGLDGHGSSSISKEVASKIAGKDALVALGKSAASFGAVAAAIAVLAVGISLVVKHYNRFETAAANAEKAAAQAAQEHQKMVDAYSSFKSNVSAYEEGAEGLKKLAKGSIEYKEALLEANNAAIQLIKSNKNLQYHVEEGRIVLDNLEAVQQQDLDALGQSSAMVSLTNNIAKEKRQEANEVALARKLNSTSDIRNEIGGAAAISGAGLIAGSLLALVTLLSGPIGWAIAGAATFGAAVIGGSIGSGIAGSASSSERQALNDIAEYVRNNDNSIFASDKEFENYLRDGLKLKDETLIKSLVENRDAVKQLTEAENARLIQERTNKKVAYSQFNMGNKKYTDAKVNDKSISQYLDSAYVAYSENEANIQRVSQEVDSLFKGKNEDFWKEWLIYTKHEDANNITTGNNKVVGDNYKVTDMYGDNASIWSKDEQGVWQRLGEKNSYNEAQARQELIEAKLMAEAAELIGMEVQEYKEFNNIINPKGQVNQDIVTSVLSAYKVNEGSADLSSFKYTDLQKIKDLKTGDVVLDNIFQRSYQNAIGDKEKTLDSISGLREKLEADGLLDLYFSLDFDKNATEETILEAVKLAQDVADTHSISLTLSTGKQLTELLSKEKKTAEDWAAIKEKYEELKAKNPEMEDWEDFRKKSQSEMINYINSIYNKTLQNNIISTATRSIEGQEDKVTKLKDKKRIAEEDLETKKRIEEKKKEAEDNKTKALNYLAQFLNDREMEAIKNDPNKIPQVLSAIQEYINYSNSSIQDHQKQQQLGQEIFDAIGASYLNSNEYQQRQSSFRTGAGMGWLQNTGISSVNLNLNPRARAEQITTEFDTFITPLINSVNDITKYEKDLEEIKNTEEELGKIERDLINSETELDQLYQDRQYQYDSLEEQITSLGYTTEEAGLLISYFIDKYDNNIDAAYDFIRALVSAKKGYEEFGTNLNDWLDKFNSKDPITVTKILNQIYDALAQILELEPDKIKKLFNKQWLETSEGKKTLQQLTDKDQSNDAEAYTTLIDRYADEEELDKDTLSLLFKQGIENITNRTEKYKSGDKMDKGLQAILASYLFNGKLTPEQIEDLAGLMGFELTLGQDESGKYRIKNTAYIGTNANFETTEKAEEKKQRYRPEDYQIAKNTKNLEQLYGQDAIEAYNNVYTSYLNKNTAALRYLKTDAQALEKIIGSGQYASLLDGEGKFSVDKLMGTYDSIYEGLTSDADKKAFDEVVNQILETNDIIVETSEQMRDAVFNKLTKSLENQLEANDNRLSEIELALSTYGDDIENAAERLSLLFNNDPTQLSQWEIYTDKVNDYQKALDELNAVYGKGEISQEQYAQGLEKIKDGSASAAKELIELNNQLRTYYEDVLSKGKEELADYTDHMEHVTEVTEYYRNVLGLIGKLGFAEETNAYAESMRKLNEYSRTSIKNRKDVAEEYYKDLAAQVEYWNTQVNQAGLTDEQKKLYEEQRDAAIDAADEAQKELFSLTESWLEAEKALIEFELEELTNALEKQLTGSFGTFEDLLDQFDKLNTRQEEYLTETNKMYETNKMMSQANKLLDETSNKAAKQKISNFVNETKKLQENTQLSEFELELQQAKYDLLLAEIALEEARGAKSTVRLTRDNEGNFGYVYTADQEAIFDAQQKVADAENKLYNKALEGQQKYQEKYFQAAEQMFNELTELQTAYINGEIASIEEYNEKKRLIEEHYTGENGILRTYQTLYNIGVRADADATADNWINNYSLMGEATNDFELDVDSLRQKTKDYLEDAEKKTESYKDIAVKAYEEVEKAIKGTIDGDGERGGLTQLMSENEELVKQITGKDGLLDALEKETTEVSSLATAYGHVIANVQGLIEAAKGINSNVISKLNSLLDPGGNPEQSNSNPTPNTESRPDKMEDGKEQTDNLYTSNPKPGGTYIVKTGDTLGELYSEAYNKSYLTPSGQYTQDFIEWAMLNGIADPNYIYTGQKLQFNTGGYTGSWGPSAKLAWLDEKELVLNANDTENILRTVSFVRELANIIESQASMSNISGFFTSPTIGNSNGTLEQKVDIHAEFPNATDRYEIEEAFTSLVNRASQYANRKW